MQNGKASIFTSATSKDFSMQNNSIGTTPPVIVEFPREFPMYKLAEFAEANGYKMRWVPNDSGRFDFDSLYVSPVQQP